MRLLAVLPLFFISTIGYSQPYNRILKWNMGLSREHLDHITIKNAINDTGAVKMEFLSWTPTVAYTHEFIFGQILSVSGTVGFQYMNMYYGSEHYGAPYFYISANPQVSIFYRKGFEYYVKLKVGGSFYIHKPDVIPEPTRRLLPGKANLFTGVTLGGFNYFFSDRMGINLELSIWSPEIATFGLSYRFYRGEIPTLDDNQNKPQNPIEKKD